MYTGGIVFLLLVLIVPTSGSTTEYTVSTNNEFIDAIGPDRTIVVAEGEIVFRYGKFLLRILLYSEFENTPVILFYHYRYCPFLDQLNIFAFPDFVVE